MKNYLFILSLLLCANTSSMEKDTSNVEEEYIRPIELLQTYAMETLSPLQVAVFCASSRPLGPHKEEALQAIKDLLKDGAEITLDVIQSTGTNYGNALELLVRFLVLKNPDKKEQIIENDFKKDGIQQLEEVLRDFYGIIASPPDWLRLKLDLQNQPNVPGLKKTWLCGRLNQDRFYPNRRDY